MRTGLALEPGCFQEGATEQHNTDHTEKKGPWTGKGKAA
jgi:hypothetical protein